MAEIIKKGDKWVVSKKDGEFPKDETKDKTFAEFDTEEEAIAFMKNLHYKGAILKIKLAGRSGD